MNVLIVSENFINGGLETQINTTVKELKDKIKFFFCFREYDEKWGFKNVFTGFKFSFNSSISEFCDDVDKLVNIMQTNGIDVVHVHPFFSIFPAVFAAKICNIPVIYTYHGIASCNFASGMNDTLLFDMLVDYEIDKILSVSDEGKNIMQNRVLNKEKIVFMPNSIDTKKFKKCKIEENKKWAIISRLDSDKINEIIDFINLINDLDIKELHIFGNGNQREYIQEYIEKNNIQNKVFLEGHTDNITEALDGKFNGVIGIGRVLMEAISMQFPTIIIGYNKIGGLIDSSIYNKISSQNFTNRELPNIKPYELEKQIQSVYSNNYDKSFYKNFESEFSSSIIADKYLEELKNTSFNSLLNLEKIYEEIKRENKNENIYNSENVFQILNKYFAPNIRQPYQKNNLIIENYIMIQNNRQKINEEKINEINNKLEIINQKLESFDQKFNGVEEYFNKNNKEIENINNNTMTYNNIKRKLKNKLTFRRK